MPKRPATGGVVEMDYDFSSVDRVLPHPVYAWMGWLCVLNPSEDTFESLKLYIQEAYEYAKEKFASYVLLIFWPANGMPLMWWNERKDEHIDFMRKSP